MTDTTPEPEDPERWPIPAEEPAEEPSHEGAEGEPPKEDDGPEAGVDPEP